MRITKEAFLKQEAKHFPKAISSILAWISVARKADWKSFGELRKDFPSADMVTVASKNKVIIFNICGNTYRLITAIHFNARHIYTLRFFTHAEYDKNNWKNEL